MEDIERADSWVSKGSRVDAIMHPVRIRIVLTVQGRRVTASELHRLLPDVPVPTLYRHLTRLVDVGMLRVEATQQVYSNQERVYTLVEGAANLTEKEVENAGPEERLRYFTVFVAGLLSMYQASLQREASLATTPVMYYTETVQLTDHRYQELCESMRRLISDSIQEEPEPGSRRRVLAAIAFPESDSVPKTAS